MNGPSCRKKNPPGLCPVGCTSIVEREMGRWGEREASFWCPQPPLLSSHSFLPNCFLFSGTHPFFPSLSEKGPKRMCEVLPLPTLSFFLELTRRLRRLGLGPPGLFFSPPPLPGRSWNCGKKRRRRKEEEDGLLRCIKKEKEVCDRRMVLAGKA